MTLRWWVYVIAAATGFAVITTALDIPASRALPSGVVIGVVLGAYLYDARS